MQQKRRLLIGSIALAAAGVVIAGCTALIAANKQPPVEAPRFEVDPFWPKPLPNHWLLGSAVGVAVDSRDHVFVINRRDSFNARTEIGAASDPPGGECCLPAPEVLEFDPDGNLVAHWGGPGEGYDWPSSPHGVAVDPAGNVWIGGNGPRDSHLLQFTRAGHFVRQFGKPAPAPVGAAAPAAGGRGGPPPVPPAPPNSQATDAFGGAAKITFDPAAGEAYIADGYRNRRVAVIDMRTGLVKRSFGAYGNRPDDTDIGPYDPDASAPARQFRTPVHCAQPSADGLVYVCDRSNNRIQVFRKNGTFVKEKVIAPRTRGEGAVWDIAFSGDPRQRFIYVADGGNMRVHILDRESLEVITSFGGGGRQPGQFHAVHSIATDSRGNIYTTEAYEGKRVQKFTFMGVGPVTSRDQGVLWPGGTR